jgi:hypothetical protein
LQEKNISKKIPEPESPLSGFFHAVWVIAIKGVAGKETDIAYGRFI